MKTPYNLVFDEITRTHMWKHSMSRWFRQPEGGNGSKKDRNILKTRAVGNILWRTDASVRLEESMNGPEKRVEQPDPIDERILVAALSEFRQRGYYKANLDDLAGRIGLGKATIYRHFKNKSVLFAAVLFHVMRQASERISGTLQKETFDSRLDAYLEVLSAVAGEGAFLKEMAPEAAREVFLREKAFPKEGSALLDRMMALRKDLIRVLTEILEQGLSEGRITSECEPGLTAEFVTSLVHSFCANRSGKDSFLTPAEMRCLNRFVRRAIGDNGLSPVKKGKETP